MAKKKMALGKGIASLIQQPVSAPEDVAPEVVNRTIAAMQKKNGSINNEMNGSPLLVAIESIKTNPNQPRKIFKEKELKELSESIKENGIIQPLIVLKNDEDGGFELIAGERRLRASMMAGLEKVPVVVKKATDRDRMIISIIENVQRSDLNCVEEALAYYQLMEDFNLTQEEVAKKLGKERSTIANFLRILKLPRAVLDMVQKDLLSFGHAKILVSVKDKDQAVRLANLTVSKQLSVRELEKEIKATKSVKRSDSRNPFFDEKLDKFKDKLEQKTGFHFAISSKSNGNGNIAIKFSNEAEFNDIYDFLLNR